MARLSAAATVQWSRLAPTLERAQVLAMVERRRTDATPEWRDRLHAESWEVPIIEVWTNAIR